MKRILNPLSLSSFNSLTHTTHTHTHTVSSTFSVFIFLSLSVSLFLFCFACFSSFLSHSSLSVCLSLSIYLSLSHSYSHYLSFYQSHLSLYIFSFLFFKIFSPPPSTSQETFKSFFCTGEFGKGVNESETKKNTRNLEMNSIFLRRVPQLWSVSIDLPTKKEQIYGFTFLWFHN